MYTRLEPLLMQLDYSMKAEADALHHKHDKRSKGLLQPRGQGGGPWLMARKRSSNLGTLQSPGLVCPPPLSPFGHLPAVLTSLERQGKNAPPGGDEPLAETESESEAELSGFSPVVRFKGDGVSSRRLGDFVFGSHLSKGWELVGRVLLENRFSYPSPVGFILVVLQVDVKKTALALAITDSELSDEEASILESGGFSVSRATTPQLTDVSEGMGSPLPLPLFLFTVKGWWLCSLIICPMFSLGN